MIESAHSIQKEDVAVAPKKSRRLLRRLGKVLIVIFALMAVGAVYESLSEAADIRAYPPPGKMVDVGGYRLHIKCTGSGSPTVVNVSCISLMGEQSTSTSMIEASIP